MPKQICVYADEGAHPFSVKEACRSLKQELPHQTIALVNRQDIASGVLERSCLLVMPGGRDIPYHNALKGAGNARIRSFVELGGAYLGICAGAYYGSSEVLFEEGLPLEVKAKRELAFFPGPAVGTLFQRGRFAYDSEQGACPAPVLFQNRVLHVYYNGGCYFPNSQEHAPSIDTLARYACLDSPAAIVACQVGLGRAILSGVHIEFAASQLKRLAFACTLADYESDRRRLWRQVLRALF
ncbi:MAG: uncharacterized protein K0S07_259 [Chlamydiales bacterium]|jgi:biotin--protein ligase|nr:uncharacterized protein [Chlamydiales bacterium]